MSTAQAFCEALPWSLDFLWQGMSGVHRLDDERRATVELAIRGYGDHYPGMNVTIASKRAGTIASKYFRFDDFLSERADNRTDHPIGKNTTFEVVAYCGWKWYIATPAHPEHFTQAVEAWIEEWR